MPSTSAYQHSLMEAAARPSGGEEARDRAVGRQGVRRGRQAEAGRCAAGAMLV